MTWFYVALGVGVLELQQVHHHDGTLIRSRDELLELLQVRDDACAGHSDTTFTVTLTLPVAP